MPNKKINELSPRTPTITDLLIVGDPNSGYSYKATINTIVNFVGGNIQFSSLGGISITSPSNGQYLTFNGTNWVNSTLSTTNWDTAYNRSLTAAAVSGTTTKTLTLTKQDGSTLTASWSDLNTDAVISVFGRTGAVVAAEGDYSLDQLGDVIITTPSTNQVLQYNGTSWVNATFVAGINSLNGLTATTQTFATGTSGTDFAISSTTSTHTFNLPTASATNRGALSSADWSTFNSKQSAITLTTTGSSGASTFVSNTLNIPTYTLAGLGGISGSGTTNYLSKWTSSSALGNSLLWDNGTKDISLGAASASSIGSNVPTLNLVGLSDAFTGGIYFRSSGNTVRGWIYATQNLFNVGSETSIPLTFQTFGVERARFTTSGRLLIGTTTESTYELDVVGDIRSTLDANINGLTVGRGGGSVSSNTAVGGTALSANTTGINNTAVGFGAGQSLTTGTRNTYIGWGSGILNTTASNNTFIGNRAGWNSTADGNTGIGVDAGFALTTALQSTLIGVGAGSAVTTGHNNVLIGYQSGSTITTGLNNTVIGYSTTGITTGNYNTIIGSFVTGLSSSISNTIILADGQGNQRLYINSDGNASFGTTTSIPNRGRYLQVTSVTNTDVGLVLKRADGTYPTRFDLYIPPSLAALRIYNSDYGDLIQVSQNGNTLIGTTTDAGYKLDVNGTFRAQTNGSLLANTTISNLRVGSGAVSLTGLDVAASARFTLGTDYRFLSNGGGQFVLFVDAVNQSVGVGNNSTINASAILDVSSTTKGFLPPRLTTTQKTSITTPGTGLVVFDTTLAKLCVYTGSAWETVTSI